MHVRVLATLALLCGALTASGQTNTSQATTRSISLTECVQLALTRNLDLQIQQLTTEIARYDLNAAYGVFLPAFSIQARHDSLSVPGSFDPQKFNPDFPYTLETDTVVPTLSGLLPVGLSYELAGSLDYREARTDFSSDRENSANYFWGIRDTNNYFASGGIIGRRRRERGEDRVDRLGHRLLGVRSREQHIFLPEKAPCCARSLFSRRCLRQTGCRPCPHSAARV